MQPQNHKTYRHLAVQRWSARNRETMKPIVISMYRDGVHETMKPRNLSTSCCPEISVWVTPYIAYLRIAYW